MHQFEPSIEDLFVVIIFLRVFQQVHYDQNSLQQSINFISGQFLLVSPGISVPLQLIKTSLNSMICKSHLLHQLINTLIYRLLLVHGGEPIFDNIFVYHFPSRRPFWFCVCNNINECIKQFLVIPTFNLNFGCLGLG